MSSVEFRSSRKVYDDGTVGLEGLDLTIDQGEFLVLLGPSGCGKSTALRLLAGLENLSDGAIMIDGSRVNDLPPGARELGMVFQSYALYPHMTVRQNLSFGLERTKTRLRLSAKEIQSRVNDAAELLDLHAALDKKPRELSGGQQQRVAIGRALVRRPKVLLMDEPLSNLDAKLRNRMRFEIRRLHQEHGTTTVYVTHDQIEAMTLADRVAILNDGRLQQHASPLTAYHEPANAFVASFLGTPAMNLIDGTAQDGRFVAGELVFDLPSHLADRQGPATFGVRPEDVRFVENGGVYCRVTGIERLGGESIIYLEACGYPLRAFWHRSGAESLPSADDQAKFLRISLSVSPAVMFEGNLNATLQS